MNFRVSLQLAGLVLSFSTQVFAQGFVDNALLFSRTKPGGSARVQAMGGAQIALGGDFSSGLSNPAGLGMYNRSEFTFSPGLNYFSTDASHNGEKETEANSKLNIPGLSYVFNSPREDRGGFLGGSFAISMTRTNDLNASLRYRGNDNISSIVDWFIQDANGTLNNDLNFDFPTGLAYDNFLIDDSTFWGGPQRFYFSALGLYDDPDDIRRLRRNGSITTKGAQYQWSFAYGGNFQDKVFFGANIGVTSMRYRFSSTYQESNFVFDLDPDYNPLDNLQLEETIDIEGTGVNLTLGVIYRPTDFIQVGASLVTPTYYQITDSYVARLSTRWNNFNYLGTGDILNALSYESNSPIISEYNLVTPLKFSLGTAFFLGSYGFITGDVEFVDYRKAKYNSDISGISFNPENDAIKALFSNTINYRIGAEFRYNILRFRTGYNVMANPYASSVDVDRSIKTISAGLGVRLQKFFIDMTLLNSTGRSEYSPYVFQDNTGPIVNLKNKLTSAIMTVGFTF